MAQSLNTTISSFTDKDGKPLSYGHIVVYKAGTTDLADVWADQGETVVLDASKIPLSAAGQVVIHVNEMVDVLSYDKCGAPVDTIPRAQPASGIADVDGDALTWV